MTYAKPPRSCTAPSQAAGRYATRGLARSRCCLCGHSSSHHLLCNPSPASLLGLGGRQHFCLQPPYRCYAISLLRPGHSRDLLRRRSHFSGHHCVTCFLRAFVMLLCSKMETLNRTPHLLGSDQSMLSLGKLGLVRLSSSHLLLFTLQCCLCCCC